MLKKEDVLKVSQLARLSITESEAEEYGQQFEKILGYFDALSGISTEQVDPLVTPIALEMFLREDQVTQTNTVDDILSNAPDIKGHLFKVPPVV